MAKRKAKDLNKETDKKIFFYTPTFYCFDNFSSHQVRIWGKTFPTAEHAYQWKKFEHTHPDIAENILHAESPWRVKHISDKNKSKVKKNWEEIKVAMMKEIVIAKYSQHKDVQDKLMMTGTKIIVENSPTDNFWGIGEKGKGKNVLGKIWMMIRNNEFEKTIS